VFTPSEHARPRHRPERRRSGIAASLGAVLDSEILPGLSNGVIDEFWLRQKYFRDALFSERGAGFSLRPTLMQSASFRFQNRCHAAGKLFFVGAGVRRGVTCAKVVKKHLWGSVL
jgi:phytoene dehydrogenase-like protein